MYENTLIIRADANIEIGTGHFMRCMALAQAWKDSGGEVIYITDCRNERLLQRLLEEDFGCYQIPFPSLDSRDWEYTKNILAKNPGAWVVLDGYHFNENYQMKIKRSDHKLLVVDDMAHLKQYYADIILNQNLHAEQLTYSCQLYTRLLLGVQYVLLRKEFLKGEHKTREIPEIATKILVTLGGSDPDNHTLKILQALKNVSIPELEVIIVAGASNPNIKTLIMEKINCNFSCKIMIDVKNMTELMEWADAAISGAGITLWELCYKGVPSLLFALADNQDFGIKQIKNLGIAKVLGWVQEISEESLTSQISSFLRDKKTRAKFSEKSRQLVDGNGVQRVISALYETGENILRIRYAVSSDSKLVWEWANDPVTREVSFSPENISWADHERWFKEKLADSGCFQYILLNNVSVPIGQVRFDITNDKAEISVNIAPTFRGRGYGAEGIKLTSKQFFREANVLQIQAYIKPDNNKSIKAFKKAGYKSEGLVSVKGRDAMCFTLDRKEN